MEKTSPSPLSPVDIAGSSSPVRVGGFWGRVKSYAHLETEPSRFATAGTSWSNQDLDPVPYERQTWRTYNFATYWISDAFSVSIWRIGASLISVGLSWKLALVACVVGNLVTAVVVTFNSIIGARLHIPFPIQARSAYGFYFSYVMVIFRVVVGVFWYGINTYTGAECVQSIILSWAPNFRNIHNALPASANIDTGLMICYFIYFVIVLPFHWIPAHKLKYLFDFKAIACPIAGFAIMGWVINETGGGSKVFQFGNEASGSQLGWAFLSGVNAMIGNFATLGVNMNDFARYSRKETSPYIQLVVIPITFIMMMLFGIIAANGTRILYDEVLWDPLQIINNWTSPGGRAGAFFVALAFLIANIGINISANSLSAAVDLATLFPKWVDLRRGQFICAFLGAWAITPWNILASASALLNFMSGYTIWLAPMAGILIADYYVVQHQRLSVPDMYDPRGIYMYERWGTNWRSAVAFVIGFAPLLPGFAQAVAGDGKVNVSAGASHIYALGYWYGFLVAGAVHIVLSWIWPPKNGLTGRTIREHMRQQDVHHSWP